MLPFAAARWGNPAAMGAVVGAPMVTPIFADMASTGPSNSATQFAAINGTSWSTTSAAARNLVMAVAGTIGNLQVRFPTAVAGGTTYDITLMVNGVASALTCQVTSAGITASDTSHFVSVSPGDTLVWRSVPTGTPNTNTAVQISCTFTSTANGEGVLFAGSQNNAQSTSVANYLSVGGSVTWSATEASVSTIMPTAGVIDKLYFWTATAPGAGKSYVHTVYKNGSPTGLTVTLTGTGSGNGITTANDTTHTVSVVAGDLISIEAAPSGTPAGTAGAFAMRWTPTVAGEAVVSQVIVAAVSSASTRFPTLSGATLGSTENSYQLAPVALTVKKLYTAVDVVPGGSANRVVTLRKGNGTQSSQALTCTIGSAQLTNNDTSNSVAASAGDLLNWQEVPNSTPTAAALIKTSAVLVV